MSKDPLHDYVEGGTLAGAVTLIGSREKVHRIDAVGWADIGLRRPMDADDLFWIASMSKPITCTAFMMLVDEGRIDVSDPVEKHLPTFKGQRLAITHEDGRVEFKAPARPITVEDILRHTSGMPFMTRVESTIDALPLAEAGISYALSDLGFEPGSQYLYSNCGSNTVGLLIQALGGMPYERFIQERLFDPLGMRDTTFWPSEEQVQRLAKTYCWPTDTRKLTEVPIHFLRYSLTRPDRFPCPAGGLFSTVEDMYLFGQMILSGGEINGRRYISPESLAAMTTTHTGDLHLEDNKPGTGYGYGWATMRDAETGAKKKGLAGPAGHAGACGTSLWVDPDNDLVLVYMIQHTSYGNEVDGGVIRKAFDAHATEAYGRQATRLGS